MAVLNLKQKKDVTQGECIIRVNDANIFLLNIFVPTLIAEPDYGNMARIGLTMTPEAQNHII